VELLAKRASLASAGHSAQVRVGKTVHSSLPAGRVSFSVPLSASGKSALSRHRRLALIVRVLIKPVSGSAITLVRGVVLH
jgi:hypothetical protein